MHLELVVPALLGSAAQDSARQGGAQVVEHLPALEMLLARGRRNRREAADFESWLSFVFNIDKTPLPAGALSALGLGVDPGDRFWLRADPVHLRADRDRLLLFPSQGFAFSDAEAEQLGGALLRHFSDRFSLKVLRADVWVLCTDGEAELHSKPPIELAGQNVDPNLPEKRWHALLNEMQMAMYQHPVNTEREAHGEPAVNSVWLWGGGRLPAPTRSSWQSVSGEDPVALGLARLAGVPSGPTTGAREWLAQAPEDGRHLVVLDALRAPRALGDDAAFARGLRALEERWFAPLLDSLRSERIGMVSVHVPEPGLSFETIRGDLRRFWRRPRRIAAYAT